VPELKIGVQISSLGLPLKKGLETAFRVGARAVELDARQHVRPGQLTSTGLRQLKKTLDDLDLKVCGLGFRTRRGYNVIEKLQERIEATKQVMSMAYQLGANVVVNQIGRVPEEAEGQDWDLLVDVLSELGRHAHHCGAFLAAETGSESGPQLAKLIAALPEGSLGVTLNPGNLVVNSFSAAEAVDAIGTSIMYVHAKDGVRDLAQGRGVEVPLGRGSADFPTLIGKLEEHTYRGYFTVERENADDPVGEVAAAIEYLKNM
jgi:sugar phosphate isomerase/epimerase